MSGFEWESTDACLLQACWLCVASSPIYDLSFQAKVCPASSSSLQSLHATLGRDPLASDPGQQRQLCECGLRIFEEAWCAACFISSHYGNADLNSCLFPTQELPYHLVGVIEHTGTMRAGHYVAYVRRPVQPEGKADAGEEGKEEQDLIEGQQSQQPSYAWFHVSDANVKRVSQAQVLRAQAYVLMYELI